MFCSLHELLWFVLCSLYSGSGLMWKGVVTECAGTSDEDSGWS